MDGCVVVFGVSGVGKTSACKAYVARHPDTLFVSASTLLKSAMRATGEALRTAKASEIVSNQERLGAGLALFRAGREERPVLIDAHGVIDNDRKLVRVPVSAIRSLSPDRLVLIQASPAEIAARRAMDARPRPIRSIKEIERELKAECKAVRAFANELGLDLLIGEAGPGFSLDALLDVEPTPALRE